MAFQVCNQLLLFLNVLLPKLLGGAGANLHRLPATSVSIRDITPRRNVFFRLSRIFQRCSPIADFSLESLTKRAYETIMGDDSAGQFEQGLVDVSSSFVSDPQAPEVMKPGQAALDDPAGFAQTAAVRHTSLCQQRFDATLFQCIAMGLRIVTTLSLHGFGTLWRTTSFAVNVRNRIEQRQQLGDVVAIGFGQDNAQRHAPGIGQQMVLGAGFAPVNRAGTCFFPAPMARTEEESTTAKDQSNSPSCCKRLSTNWCNLSQTPASCQSRRRRQQVMPHPQPISWGRYSHGMPVFKTNKIPISAWRLLRGLRPGYFLRRGLGGGRTGSINCHNLSSKIALAMSAPQTQITTTSMPKYSFC